RSGTDDRPPSRASRASARGKSELRRAVRRVTPGRGNPKESGTENIPPTFAPSARGWVRVKRCGKSAPRSWQHGWQAKPRTEQGQIGERSTVARASERRWKQTARLRLPGRLLDPVSNDGARGMIVVSPKRRKARRREQDSAYGAL